MQRNSSFLDSTKIQNKINTVNLNLLHTQKQDIDCYYTKYFP